MKHALIVTVSVLGLFGAIYFGQKALDPGYEKERAEILRVAYSHPDITSRVGSVRTASFATKKKEGLAVLSRFFQDDWSRDRSQGTTKGSARLFVLGSREGGDFVVRYTYVEKDGRFMLESVDTSAFDSPPKRPIPVGTVNSGELTLPFVADLKRQTKNDHSRDICEG